MKNIYRCFWATLLKNLGNFLFHHLVTLVSDQSVWQGTLTVEGSITVRLVSSFTSLDSTASLHTNSNIFYILVKYRLVKLEISRIVILPPMASVLWLGHSFLAHPKSLANCSRPTWLSCDRLKS